MAYREGWAVQVELLEREVAAARRRDHPIVEGQLMVRLAEARAWLAETGGPPLPGRRLRRLRIASPCSADWDAMAGDDQVRFCAGCNKNVFNVSAMSTGQAEALLGGAAGPPCVRFYRRAEGTVMTSDCPVGTQRRRPLRAGAVAGALLAAGAALELISFGESPSLRLRPRVMLVDSAPHAHLVQPPRVPGPRPVPIMGPPPLIEYGRQDTASGEGSQPAAARSRGRRRRP